MKVTLKRYSNKPGEIMSEEIVEADIVEIDGIGISIDKGRSNVGGIEAGDLVVRGNVSDAYQLIIVPTSANSIAIRKGKR